MRSFPLLFLSPLFIVLGACRAEPYSAQCPSSQQFCVTEADGGCQVAELACCDGHVPGCAGSYAAESPSDCATLETGDCF